MLSIQTPIRSTGRRKCAVAQVLLISGSGSFRINSQPAVEYLHADAFLLAAVLAPFEKTKSQDAFDITVKVKGGGLVGQAFAIRLGIARAINAVNPICRSNLKQAGLLTRDARVKERKKFGLKKARKASQFSKR